LESISQKLLKIESPKIELNKKKRKNQKAKREGGRVGMEGSRSAAAAALPVENYVCDTHTGGSFYCLSFFPRDSF
jgi:hypothetical protein